MYEDVKKLLVDKTKDLVVNEAAKRNLNIRIFITQHMLIALLSIDIFVKLIKKFLNLQKKKLNTLLILIYYQRLEVC